MGTNPKIAKPSNIDKLPSGGFEYGGARPSSILEIHAL